MVRPDEADSANGGRLQARELNASLTVKDLSASVAWYRDLVGFAVEREYERNGEAMAVAMRAGTVSILLTRDDGARGLDRTKGEGISLQLVTRDDVDAIAARIRAGGVALETDPVDTPWGARVFRLRDPDGFRWAISSERAG